MPVVEIVAGRLSGRHAGEAIAFQGIPYATALRFAPPGPMQGWKGVRDARAPGPAAPQPRRPAATFTHGELPGTDEQCLSLNVFAPELSGRRPVFVWLHGGGFAIGHAGASLYSGVRLAADVGAVVVTVSYRLGSLGWLGHPGLAAAPDAPAANGGDGGAAVYAKSRAAWVATRQKIETDIAKLRDAMSSVYQGHG
ncbi:MAG: carboxylesterase family protein, partial [Solirubrobacteraceae bacterium]